MTAIFILMNVYSMYFFFCMCLIDWVTKIEYYDYFTYMSKHEANG